MRSQAVEAHTWLILGRAADREGTRTSPDETGFGYAVDTFKYPRRIHLDMVDPKIQFREDPQLLAFLAARGLNPNEVARKAFEAEVQRMKGDDWLTSLRGLQKKMKPFDVKDIVRDIREARDSQ